jgi:7-cyano-7-deazaguanine reductase
MYDNLELGKNTEYHPYYNPHKLQPIARKLNRAKLKLEGKTLPFFGIDIWNHFEVSWLNNKGKPEVALAVIEYPADSPNIIESKSMKLYFNSFNNSKFTDAQSLTAVITEDLRERISSEVKVQILPVAAYKALDLQASMLGTSIDNLDIECSVYELCPDFLVASEAIVTEVLCSDLLKSNCLVTNQPDFGSIAIEYTGPQIDRAGLLRYIVSFRNCNEFAETCVERIFMDVWQHCNPTKLSVYTRFTKRGGLDINSVRTNHNINLKQLTTRLCRQ